MLFEYVKKIFSVKEVYIRYFVISMAILKLFDGIFEKKAIFHDEIINLYKAESGLIFDYALRPLFYFLNQVASSFMGAVPQSLYFLAAVFGLSTVILIFSAINKITKNTWFGLSGAVIFLSFDEVFKFGIRPMAHIYCAFFISLSFWTIVCALQVSSLVKRKVFFSLSGISTGLVIATHPTGLGFVLGVMAWFCLLFLLKRTKRFHNDSGIFPEYAISFATVVFILINIITWFNYGQPYVLTLLSGVEKVQDVGQFSYHEPWYYYLNYLQKNHRYQISFTALALIIVAVGLKWKKSLNRDAVLGFSYICFGGLFGLIAINLISWKFERVWVGFAPLEAIFMALVWHTAYSICIDSFTMQKYRRYWSLSSAALITAFLGFLVSNQISLRNATIDQSTRSEQFSEFNVLFWQLKTLDKDCILYSNFRKSPSDFKRISRYAFLTNKKMIQSSHQSSDLDSIIFESTTLTEQCPHGVIYAFGVRDLKQNVLEAFRKTLEAKGAKRTTTWRGYVDFWLL